MANEILVRFDRSVEIKNTDFEVTIKQNKRKLGTLLLSRGNIEWLPSGNHVNKFRLSWRKFARMMEEKGVKITLG